MKAGERGLFRLEIVRNEIVKQGYHIIEAAVTKDFPPASPGQFVSVRVSPATDPLLRRPYSIMDIDSGTLSLLVAVVGKASSFLASKRPGEKLDLMGPLGGSIFPPPRGGAVLVGGGTGIAPLVYAARSWQRNGLSERAVLLYGAQCEGEICDSIVKDSFHQVHFSTMDGTAGFHGDVVTLCQQMAEERKLDGGMLYSCGPRRMIFELDRRLGGKFSDHYTSLEAVMACGVGACRGCTVPVMSGDGLMLKPVCQDGTVFRAGEIAWKEWDW